MNKRTKKSKSQRRVRRIGGRHSIKVEKTPYHSWKAGGLVRGCEQCVRGEKLVLFVTGLCGLRCDFCPVSDRKLYQDVVYANERPTREMKEIIEEARLCSAKGAGMTGGDPLMKMDRTVKYIKALKKTFGKKFHIHLYTPLKLVDKRKLKALHDAGLDEIRFHPWLDKAHDWEKIDLARAPGFKWKVGVEIPVIPGKKKATEQLISHLKGRVDFLNLNELELADNAVWRRRKEREDKKEKDNGHSLKCKDDTSYAIKGSDELAKELIRYAAQIGVPTHYCTCTLKDRVQLGERVKRRAKSVKLATDRMTQEGMLVRGSIYLPTLKPGFGYHDKLFHMKAEEKRNALKRLRSLKEKIAKESKVKKSLLTIDEEKLRILTSAAVSKKLAAAARGRHYPGYECAEVTEYPTFDALELEVEFFN
ncbi:radical SAM protein [Candidatus Woesearchaeota archaeon]|nr:radical SAM protein [Candidatus Woesearchaeota archaeon]